MLAPTTLGPCGGAAQESVTAHAGRGSFRLSISAALEHHPNFDQPVFLPAQILPDNDLVVATVVATASAPTSTALRSSFSCGIPVRAYPTLAQPGAFAGAGAWKAPPVEQWPSGWMPHHGSDNYHKAKARDEQDAFALSLQLESDPEVPDQLEQVINFALQNTTDEYERLMAQIFEDKRNQEAQQRASRERREQQARMGEEAAARMRDAAAARDQAVAAAARDQAVAARVRDQAVAAAARDQAARAREARMREAKVRLAQAAATAEPPPPSKGACLAPLAVSGKRQLVAVAEAEAAPAPKKVRGPSKKLRAKIVPPPQPLGGRSDWRISQDAVSIKLGIRDEKDMLDRLHSLNPEGDKRALVKHVQGFKNILTLKCAEFHDLRTLMTWRQGNGLTLQATAHHLFARMYHELSETDPAETSHILDAVTLWTEGLGDGQGVCMLSQLCAMEA